MKNLLYIDIDIKFSQLWQGRPVIMGSKKVFF